MFLRWLLLLALPACAAMEVDPPSWWADHSLNPVRLLLRGDNLKPGPLRTGSPHLKAGPVTIGAGGRYAFADLTITPGAAAGRYTLDLNGTKAAFDLLKPLPREGRFQGFGTDDVLYLVMVDRFANGDRSNDGPLVDTSNARTYQGGDLEGIRQRLPYLKHFGITTLWLTPVYDNAAEARNTRYGRTASYHGYGAVDLYRLEEYFGAAEKLRELVDAAHAVGMKIVLDQVANHVGAEHPWAQHPPLPGWFNGTVERHLTSASQMWSLLDRRATLAMRRRTLEGWFAGRLPDLNQNNPEVARYLIQNTLWWIGTTGIDGIRQDTVPYVPAAFWKRWNAAIAREFPNLSSVGEVYYRDPRMLAHFAGTGFASSFDFPLYFAIRDVFAKRTEELDELPYVLSHDSTHRDPARLVTFLGLHDVRRFRTEAKDTGSLRDAFTFLLTMRGIPMIYYGDEIAMEGSGDPDNRRVFPPAAFEPSGRTPEQKAMFDHVQSLLALRRRHPALREGTLLHLAADDDYYVYARRAAGETVLCVLGKAPEVDVSELALPDSAVQPDALGTGNTAGVEEGKLTVSGPGVYVFKHPANRGTRRRAPG